MNRVRGRSTTPSHHHDSDGPDPKQAPHACPHADHHKEEHTQKHNITQSLFDDAFALRDQDINNLIRKAFLDARTGFEPVTKEGRASFPLPQWPGLIWPYLIASRGVRDEETLAHQNRSWVRRFHGIHPSILAKAGLSANQEELDVPNPTPAFFGSWMDRVAAVLPNFMVGGGGMAVVSPEGTNRWSARNTYRLTVWSLLLAASKYLGEIKVGIATPGGLDLESLLKVHLNQKTAFVIVQPPHEIGLFETDREGKVLRDASGEPIPLYERDIHGHVVLNGKGEPKQARKPYRERQDEAWNDFAMGGFPTHTLFGYGFHPSGEDRSFNIRKLAMIAQVSSFQETGARLPGIARAQAEIALTPITACYAYAMRVRLLAVLNQPATPPEDLIRRFADWWMEIPEYEGRLLMHLVFSPGEKPYGAPEGTRRNYAYLVDEMFFQMALGLTIPEGWRARQKVRDRMKRLISNLQSILAKCPWPSLIDHVTRGLADFYTPNATTQLVGSGSDWGGGQSRTGGVGVDANPSDNSSTGTPNRYNHQVPITNQPAPCGVTPTPTSDLDMKGGLAGRRGASGEMNKTSYRKELLGTGIVDSDLRGASLGETGEADEEVLPSAQRFQGRPSTQSEASDRGGVSTHHLKGADQALEGRLRAFGLLGGIPTPSADKALLGPIARDLAAITGATGVPVGLATVEKGLQHTPWSPRGIWLLLDTLRRTRRLKSPAGLVARILKGDLTASTGGLLPMVGDMLALAESNTRSGWRQCPFGAPSDYMDFEPLPGRDPEDDIGPLFRTVQLTVEQAASVDRMAQETKQVISATGSHWNGLADRLDDLPENEREWARLGLALREVLGEGRMTWFSILGPAKLLDVTQAAITLGVEKKHAWALKAALDSLVFALPEAQEKSGVKKSLLFQVLEG